MMTWTDERIEQLKVMWEEGQTASQIAEALGGVSRNAVIGKAHRLELQARPSPVRTNGPAEPPVTKDDDVIVHERTDELVSPATVDEEQSVEMSQQTPADAAVMDEAEAGTDAEAVAPAEPDAEEAFSGEPVALPRAPAPQPVMRSVGPGGFVR